MYKVKVISLKRRQDRRDKITHMFQQIDFDFVDTTELKYGLPERSYNSFIHAAEEAAISRLYGGIHYMMAIEEGVTQGNKVGVYIINNLQTKL